MTELKPCPFCGKVETLEISNCSEAEGCYKFEVCTEVVSLCVVCNINNGGCGGCGGYRRSKENAAEAWNKRVK